jgi:hypothetical protein
MSISANSAIANTPMTRSRTTGRGLLASSGRSLSPTVFFGRILGARGARSGCGFDAFFGLGLTFRGRPKNDVE